MASNLFALLLLLPLALAQDDDIINTDNIPVFPKGYNHKIRAGYLSVTPYTQSFYYILAERYRPSQAARTVPQQTLSSCGSTVAPAAPPSPAF